jgi:hypothetical protein
MMGNSHFSLSSTFGALSGFPFTTTAIRPADLGLVFGNPKLIPELAETAARFYHAGFFPRIAVSGGVFGPSEQPEARELAELLQRFDIPETDIFIEDQSQHTGQNVTKTRAVLDREGVQVRSLIGFGCASAGPRFLMTLAQRWPEVLAMHIGVYPKGLGHHNCLQSESFLRCMFDEVAKIDPYLERGEIRSVDLMALNQAIWRFPAESRAHP